MKYIIKNFKTSLLLAFSAVLFLSSCNKKMEQLSDAPVTPPTGLTLAQTMAASSDSLYYKLLVRGGLINKISRTDSIFTMFVPDNNAMRVFVNAASGGAIPVAAPDAVHSAFISGLLPAASANAIGSFNICPQAITTASIPATFPNFQYPSILNPAPALSAFLRLTTFPSTRNGAYLNNIPLLSTNTLASNGVIHKTAAIALPPSQYLWDRINTDATFSLLKAAIQRADADPTAPGALQSALLNIGANLTVYAPDTTAFKNVLSFLSGGALNPAMPNAVFAGFIGTLPITTVKGIVVYHIMGTRAFSNNFPTTVTNYPTLLNGAIPAHPGLGLRATFTGPMVSAATVKGAANGTASNVLINPTPAPGGSSDQFYLNGVLHRIDQVLLPQ